MFDWSGDYSIATCFSITNFVAIQYVPSQTQFKIMLQPSHAKCLLTNSPLAFPGDLALQIGLIWYNFQKYTQLTENLLL